MIASFLRPARRRLAALVALVSLAPVAALGQAVAEAEPATGLKTVAVVALSGYDALMEDVDFLGALGGKPASKDFVEGLIAIFTGGRGVEGLDKSRPIGVVLQTDGASFTPLGCLPIADLDPVLELVENFGFEPFDAGDGVYELELPDQTIYFKQAGEWTFVSQTLDGLAAAPADPTQGLAKMVSTYDLGATILAQNVPDMYRQIALEQLRQGMEEGLEQEEDESDDDFAQRRALAEAQIDQLGDLIEGLNRVTFGWAIDSEGKQMFLDVELTGVAGSDMALAMSVYENSTSGVTGFHRPAAAASFLTTGKTPPELLEKQREQVDATVEMLRNQAAKAIEEGEEIPDDPKVREALQGAADDLIDAYGEMLREGKMELGGSLNLAGEGYDLIAGAYVSDPSKIESAFKKLADAAAESDEFPGVEWNYATHAGVTLHGMTIPVPEEGKARQTLGDTLRVILGVGNQRVYFAAGPRGEEALKSAIDESAARAGQEILPGEMQVSLRQVLAAVEPVAEGPAVPMIGMMLETLEKAPAGADHLVVTAESIEGGVRVRYLLEQGVLEAVGQMAAQAAAMQQQQQRGGGF